MPFCRRIQETLHAKACWMSLVEHELETLARQVSPHQVGVQAQDLRYVG